jgi:hypothetical protein
MMSRSASRQAQFVRGINAEPGRMVGQDQRVRDVPGTSFRRQPLNRRHRERLVRGGVRMPGRALGPAEQFAVEGLFELPQHRGLVRARGGEHGGVLGGGDVPLQALEDQQSRVLRPGTEDLRVFLVSATGVRVPEVAVLGEDHPVQPELGGPTGQVRHPVLGVVAVDAVHVVIPDEVHEIGAVIGRRRGRRGQDRAGHGRGGESRAEQAGGPQQAAP